MKSKIETAIDEKAMINLGKYTLDTKLLLAKIELLTAWNVFANKFQNNIPEYMTIWIGYPEILEILVTFLYANKNSAFN
mgnify:CR=1 FL=1